MSKKSVVIALPVRSAPARVEEPREADSWVNAPAPKNISATVQGFGMIDLDAPRGPFELAWMIWTFPAIATIHWMASAMAHPRPR